LAWRLPGCVGPSHPVELGGMDHAKGHVRHFRRLSLRRRSTSHVAFLRDVKCFWQENAGPGSGLDFLGLLEVEV
jgi:hypothetical protein